jgi:hypothetical protein
MNKPEPINYNAFNDKDDDFEPSSNLKLDNSKSRFSQKEKKITKEEFDAEVSKQIKNHESYMKEAALLGRQFWVSIFDKTLQDNKTVEEKNNEKEILNDLKLLANKINIDPSEIEGSGSVGLCVLLIGSIFHLRDRINELNYEIQKLKNKK